MTVRKILLAACAAALTASPAWAHPGRAPSNDGAPTGNSGGHHGKSHRCVARGVGYVAAGTLVSQTLALDPPAAASSRHGTRPTYSGDVTIAVTRTNHQARGDKGTTKTYTLDHARVVLGLADTNRDGSVGLDDLAAGDRVKVVGKVTVLRRRCDQTGFTPKLTIQKLIVHAPAQQQPTG
ncbi:MAG TPA: hypothetical protein VN635_15125 [Conexibacter sp.]|nr:hypothetical protein [Conexibacter sp.]